LFLAIGQTLPITTVKVSFYGDMSPFLLILSKYYTLKKKILSKYSCARRKEYYKMVGGGNMCLTVREGEKNSSRGRRNNKVLR
jgi:hypothetical protein